MSYIDVKRREEIALDVVLGDREKTLVDDIIVRRDLLGYPVWEPFLGYHRNSVARMKEMCHRAVLRKLGVE